MKQTDEVLSFSEMAETLDSINNFSATFTGVKDASALSERKSLIKSILEKALSAIHKIDDHDDNISERALDKFNTAMIELIRNTDSRNLSKDAKLKEKSERKEAHEKERAEKKDHDKKLAADKKQARDEYRKKMRDLKRA